MMLDKMFGTWDEQDRIIGLVKKVAIHPKGGLERSTVCAVDCLEQWKVGWLDDTIKAWERYLTELDNNEAHCDCERHGAWVPAIPL